MEIPFTKMHGLSNDYVYVNAFEVDLSKLDIPMLARTVSDRHCGIGSDGLILIAPPTGGVNADVRMEMYNADGSRGEMCGNGIRCVAKYAIDHELVKRLQAVGSVANSGFPNGKDNASDPITISVETDRGVLQLDAYEGLDGCVAKVRVDMGPPILTPREIPMKFDGDRCIAAPLAVPGFDGLRFSMTCVSMGNPHAVSFVDDVARFDLTTIGPLVERHALFPNRVNFHIVTVHNRGEVTMRTWERGSGITQACGTGACAVLVAGILEDRLDRSATLHLPGGELSIEWSDDEASVFMTGPATEVFSGVWRHGQ